MATVAVYTQKYCLHCYGSDDPEVRSPREYKGITEYLDSVADYIASQNTTSQEVVILICGGMKDAKGVREADSIAPAIERRLEGRLPAGCIVRITKKYSRSSIAIMEDVFLWHRDYYLASEARITVFCDKPREGKVQYLAQQLLGTLCAVVALRRRDSWKATLLRSNRLAQSIELLMIKRDLEKIKRMIERAR